jgi:excisionase family DNA binding protein
MYDKNATNLDDLPDYPTAEELIPVFRKSRSAIYNLIASGEIPSVRIGRSIRIPKQLLIDTLNERARKWAE